MEEKDWKVPPDGFGVLMYWRKCTEILVNVENMEQKKGTPKYGKSLPKGKKRERPTKTQVSKIGQEMS